MAFGILRGGQASADEPRKDSVNLDESRVRELKRSDEIDWATKDDSYWREVLTPEQYNVARNHGTERAFTGEYALTKIDGKYLCSNCGNELFASDDKFDSGTGWPSYSKPIRPDAVKYIEDRSFGMKRTEVRCGRCNAHLGHVFDDGPKETGQRFCINSISLVHETKLK